MPQRNSSHLHCIYWSQLQATYPVLTTGYQGKQRTMNCTGTIVVVVSLVAVLNSGLPTNRLFFLPSIPWRHHNYIPGFLPTSHKYRMEVREWTAVNFKELLSSRNYSSRKLIIFSCFVEQLFVKTLYWQFWHINNLKTLIHFPIINSKFSLSNFNILTQSISDATKK